MRKLLLLLVVLIVLGLAGFFGFRWWQNRPQPVTFAFHYESGFWPPPPARVFLDGRPVAHFDTTTPFRKSAPFPVELFGGSWLAGHDTEVTLRPKQITNPALRPAVTAQILTPCGWKEIKVSPNWPDAKKLADARKNKSRPVVDAQFSSGAIEDERVELFVDNRDAADATLTLGELSVPVAAGEKRKFEFYAPTCDQATALQLNGEPIGTIPRELASRKDSLYGTIMAYDEITGWDPNPPSWVFLLDTSGKRCYQLTERQYAKKGSGGFSPGSRVLTYHGKKLHRLHAVEIHYFLERAPETIRVSQFGGFDDSTMETRGQLIESCGDW